MASAPGGLFVGSDGVSDIGEAPIQEVAGNELSRQGAREPMDDGTGLTLHRRQETSPPRGA